MRWSVMVCVKMSNIINKDMQTNSEKNVYIIKLFNEKLFNAVVKNAILVSMNLV